jgi:hypothetical protein
VSTRIQVADLHDPQAEYAEADYERRVAEGVDQIDAAFEVAQDYGLLDAPETVDDPMAMDAALGAPPPPPDPFSEEYRLWKRNWKPVREPRTAYGDSVYDIEGPAIQ